MMRRARLPVDELHFGADQVLSRGDDVEMREMHVREAGVRERAAVEQGVVQGVADAITLDADAAGRVRLRIGVDEQRLPLRGGERRGEIDGRRRLTDAALLVGNSDYAGHLTSYCIPMAYIAGVLRGANIRTGTPAVKSEFHVKRRAEVSRETQLAWGSCSRTGAPTRRAAASALSRSPSCADRWATRREFAPPEPLARAPRGPGPSRRAAARRRPG